jgi:hypothetical protein
MTLVTLKPEVKAAWLEALRSGRYTQGQGYLTTITGGERLDCCLGVLCDVAIRAGLPVDVQSSPARQQILKYDGQEGLLPLSVYRWATIDGYASDPDSASYDIDVDVPNPSYDPDDEDDDATFSATLSERNDGGDDYDDIADLIENQL